MRTFSGLLGESDKRWYIPLVRPQNFYFFFFFFNNLFYGIYDICNSISAYGKRDSLGADPRFFQRGGCKYEFKANVPGPKECGTWER